MSYSEFETEEFFYFSEKERELIETFLKSLGYDLGANVVCGSCCGMYADNYYLNGFGGWTEKSHVNEFKEFVERNKITCSFSEFDNDGYHYRISADPEEEDIKINSL